MTTQILSVSEQAHRAKHASRAFGMASHEKRIEVLFAMSAALREHTAEIIDANTRDMEAAKASNTPDGLLDRLLLTPERIEAMAQGIDDLAGLPDPLARRGDERVISGGIEMVQVYVPLGVVAMVYEARPNVTSDAIGICVKSGNACVLRGGSLAYHSNSTIARIMKDTLVYVGINPDIIQYIEQTDRSATTELLHLRGVIDVLIPRGGAGLIAHCVEESSVPVIETGTGNCHIYVRPPFDIEMARNILINAKTQRIGVCNACESLLLDEAVSAEDAFTLLRALHDAGVRLHIDEVYAHLLDEAGIPYSIADETDYGREYLDMDISVAQVPGVQAAIDHVNRYGTRHSEAIVTSDEAAAELFLAQVDAAAVYWNASTRFTDGALFGLGAEIGISTQKLHARGPFALEALTSYKYVLRGCGQVRP